MIGCERLVKPESKTQYSVATPLRYKGTAHVSAVDERKPARRARSNLKSNVVLSQQRGRYMPTIDCGVAGSKPIRRTVSLKVGRCPTAHKRR